MRFPDDPYVVRYLALRRLLCLKPIIQNPVLIEDMKLEIRKSEFISFIGASGAGKTTLLRILAGLETRFEGKVTLNNEPITRPTRKIQIVFQDNRLLPWFKVRRNIAFAAANLDRKTRNTRINEWLRNVGLDRRAKTFPKNLSGGEENRAAFARVFVEPPDVLLLDEPFRALDAVTKFELQEKLLKFVAENKTTVVLVSHSIDDAVFMSDRVLVLSQWPLRLYREFVVPKSRPRDRGNAELVRLSTKVADALKETVPSLRQTGTC